jgi:hypothetical protein
MMAGAVACGGGTDRAPAGPAGAGGALTEAERATIGHAERLLVQRCMARHGFDYWADPPLSAAELRTIGYVLDDVAWAAEHGYGSRIAEKARGSAADTRNAAYRDGLPPAEYGGYLAALAGGGEELAVELPTGVTVRSDAGGCEAEAQQELYGDRAAWFRASRITDNLVPLFVASIEGDEEFRRARATWAACMRRHGYDYAAPPEAHAAVPALARGMDRDEAFAAETELAAQEARCAGESGLAETVRVMDERHGDPVRARYAEEIALRDRLESAALLRARDITAEQN